MENDELRRRVAVAIESTWPQFQAEHPALAQVIDQAALGDYVVASLRTDGEFQDVYAEAMEARVGVSTLAQLVGRFVDGALARLR